MDRETKRAAVKAGTAAALRMSASAAAADGIPLTLEEMGIQELEPGMVEDTFENRDLLRRNDWRWTRDRDEDGIESGLLAVHSPSDQTERALKRYGERADLLTIPGNPWSEYRSPAEIVLDLAGDEVSPSQVGLPNWVAQTGWLWVKLDRADVPIEERKALPSRCTHQKYDGSRCWGWGVPDIITGDPVVCKGHMPTVGKRIERTDQEIKLNLKRRLLVASPMAIDVLEELATESVSDAVRLGAARDILDRAGVRGGTELEVSGEVQVVDAAAQVSARLDRLATRALENAAERLEAAENAEISDAVIVTEPEPETPSE
jgi:hypothetical protein